jgi:ribosome recycling factor
MLCASGAAITAPEPRLLVIQPWDAKATADIEKAIQKAGIGLTPVVDGKIVRLPSPPLTGERREELKRVAHKMAEDGRIAVRNVRRDANEVVKKLKADKQLSEDESFKSQEQVQKLTDRHIEELNKALAQKEQELGSG